MLSVKSRPGLSGATIAKRLGAVSYAEAEEFALDVRRRDVLAMNERPLKQIIEEQLRLWQVRAQTKTMNSGEETEPDG